MAASAGRKVVVVFGATGAQGGSVVRALKDDEHFHVRAATRNPNSDKAKALQSQGIEVIKVNMDEIQTIRKALEGAYAVFLVTNYWEILDEGREIKQGQNVIDAAKANNIQHLVFSSLNSAKAATGKAAAHMETKVAIEQYIAKLGVPCTVVIMAAYYENLLTLMKPRQNEQGDYVLAFPMADKPLDMVCINEVGECIHQILARPEEFKGRSIGLSSSRATVSDYAAILSKVLHPKKFVAGNITPEQYSKFGFPGAGDLAAMFELYQTGPLNFDVELTRRLNPNIQTFEQWVCSNKDAF